jgi:hypothetical protein
MKKFSSVTNQTVSSEPKVEVKIDEATIFKSRVINLLEQFLSIQMYGPVDRYQRAGLVKIKGQELFAEALLSLLDEKSTKEQTKLLESLKGNLRDWETIDNKIDEINSNKTDFKTNHKVNQLLEKYGSDEEMLVNVIEEKAKKINDTEILESYIKSINASKVSNATKEKIKSILTK